MAPVHSETQSPASASINTAGRRRAVILTLICVLLVGCTGYGLLLELGATAEQYFNSFDFYSDVNQAVEFTQKVLGSGGL